MPLYFTYTPERSSSCKIPYCSGTTSPWKPIGWPHRRYGGRAPAWANTKLSCTCHHPLGNARRLLRYSRCGRHPQPPSRVKKSVPAGSNRSASASTKLSHHAQRRCEWSRIDSTLYPVLRHAGHDRGETRRDQRRKRHGRRGIQLWSTCGARGARHPCK